MQLFVSYSRQQFYFAESVVLYLQKLGHDVWFDVQRLTPGLDWAVGIQQGLDRADALILIASQASLASPYVRKEWETFQQRGAPIYVLLYEWVELPPELHAQAVFDLRSNFLRGMQPLRDCLQAQQPCTGRVERQFLQGARPTRITLMSAALLLNVALAGLAVILALFHAMLGSAGWGIFWVLVFLAAGLSTWGDWRKFETRQLSSGSFYAALFLVPVLGVIFPFAINATAFTNAFLLYFFIGILNMTFVTRGFNLKRYHWMPRGAAESGLREGVHQQLDPRVEQRTGCLTLFASSSPADDPMEAWKRWIDELDVENLAVPENGRSIRYSIEAAAADEHLVKQVDKTMQHFQHVRVGTDEEVDQRFYVISNHTPRALLDRANQNETHLTLVLASSVDLSDEAATRCQIVDYRGRSQRQLNSIARYFAQPEKDAVTEYGLTQIPRPFTWFVLPPEIQLLTTGIRAVGSFFTALAICALLIVTGLLPFDVSMLRDQLDGWTLLFALVIGIVGIASIIGADMLAERRIRGDLFVRVSAFFSVVVMIIALVLLGRSGAIGIIASFLMDMAEDSSNSEYWIGALLLVIASVIPLTMRARLWLPRVIEPLSSEQTLRIKTVDYIRSGLRDAVFLIVLLLAAVLGSQGG